MNMYCLLHRVNVDFQSQTVSPVDVVSCIIDPDKIPPNRLFIVNITEVSPLHSSVQDSCSICPSLKDVYFFLIMWIPGTGGGGGSFLGLPG